MPFHKFVETHHGPTVTIENHGDGDAVIVVTNVKGFVNTEGVRIAMDGSEVEQLRDMLDDVLNDY